MESIVLAILAAVLGGLGILTKVNRDRQRAKAQARQDAFRRSAERAKQRIEERKATFEAEQIIAEENFRNRLQEVRDEADSRARRESLAHTLNRYSSGDGES